MEEVPMETSSPTESSSEVNFNPEEEKPQENRAPAGACYW